MKNSSNPPFRYAAVIAMHHRVSPAPSRSLRLVAAASRPLASRDPAIHRKTLDEYSIGTSSRICPHRVRVPWNAALPNPTIASMAPATSKR